VTLIPLNKIRAFKISAELPKCVPYPPYPPGPTDLALQKPQNARQVRPVLTLVGYPDEVAEAIAFVFNDSLICDDVASARAVTFARNVGVRSVTLDGDVHEPSRDDVWWCAAQRIWRACASAGAGRRCAEDA
jgi:structural maintenance of chromosome 2